MSLVMQMNCQYELGLKSYENLCNVSRCREATPSVSYTSVTPSYDAVFQATVNLFIEKQLPDYTRKVDRLFK